MDEDSIIDTNVIIVASLAAGSLGETERTPEECALVFEWLDGFRISSASIVLDVNYEIWNEYNNKLTGQDFGLLVVTEKLASNCRLQEIEHERSQDGAAIVPEAFAKLDRSDRKFLAVALADRSAGHESVIVNATDSDWRAIDEPAREHGIVIRQLLDA